MTNSMPDEIPIMIRVGSALVPARSVELIESLTTDEEAPGRGLWTGGDYTLVVSNSETEVR